MRTFGIDTSEFQGDIDFAAVKAEGRVQFVYGRAADGAHIDPLYNDNHDDCKKRGLPWGAYYFYRANLDPMNQSRHFLALIDGRQGTCLPMVDVEEDSFAGNTESAATRVANLATFNRAIEATLSGKRIIIYTNEDTWTTYLGDSHGFSGHPLWIAQSLTPQPPYFGGWQNYVLWQYGTEVVEGIAGPVDADTLHGSNLSLIAR